MSFRRASMSQGHGALRLWCLGLVLANLPFFTLGVLTHSWVMCAATVFTTMVCLAVAADARKTLEFRVFFCIGITMFWWVASIVTVCLSTSANPPRAFTQQKAWQAPSHSPYTEPSTSP